MSNTNTRVDNTVSLTYTATAPGDIISDAVIAELTRRTIATVDDDGSSGDAVVSQTPPDDTTKIWYIADSNGVPTGEAYKYNSATGQWESTSQDVPAATCVSANSENLITTDSGGCLLVSENDVRDACQAIIPHVSSDPNNQISQGTDGGWYVPPPAEPTPSTDANNSIVTGTDGKLWSPSPATVTVDHGELSLHEETVTATNQAEFYRIPVNVAGEGQGVILSTTNHDIEVLNPGTFYAMAHISCSNGGADELEFGLGVNGVIQSKTNTLRKLGTGGDLGAASFGGLLNLSPNDRVCVHVANNTASGQVVSLHTCNLSLIRLG